jgi:hypothetical protein
MSKKKRTQIEVEGRTLKPLEFRLSGPKHFFRYPDSVHILEMRQLDFEMERYRNSVPITTAELADLRRTITEWLDDDKRLLDELAAKLGYRLVRIDGEDA